MNELIPIPEFAVAPSTGGIHDVELLLAEWLGLDVANGDACADTLKTYRSHFAGWMAWCQENQVEPGRAAATQVKAYRPV
jgi:integrase/recombinase XerC/integrase/recombinase XerD